MVTKMPAVSNSYLDFHSPSVYSAEQKTRIRRARTMTTLDYVKDSIRRDYTAQAAAIGSGLDAHMGEMLKAHGMTENELNSSFQQLVDELIYPFLACMKAMEENGVPIAEADRYCRRLWDDMPEEMKRQAIGG